MTDTPDPIPQARESAVDNPLEQFLNRAPTTALGHFERLVNAIQNQDRCVLTGDQLSIETWQRIAACAAMNLAREHADEMRSALNAAALATPSGDDVAKLRAENERLKAEAHDLANRAVGSEAAAEIAEAQRDALQERVRVLEEALGPFARYADCKAFEFTRQNAPDDMNELCFRFLEVSISTGDFRRARTALTPHQQGNGGESHGG